jgi:hypothetical protein
MEISFEKPVHWHGKSFRFRWDIQDAWGVMINYHNGERRAWYRRTERGYRFRRWFFYGPQGEFRNIAHSDFPEITLYVFRGYSLVPKKIRIPIRVGALTVFKPDIGISRLCYRGVSFGVNLSERQFRSKLQTMEVSRPEVSISSLGEPYINITDLPEYTMGLTEITK